MASVGPKRADGTYRARYRDPAGREHARHFHKKAAARRWLDEVTAAVVTGQYVDPRSGRVTFRQYAEQWREGQVHRPSTQVYVERQLRRHAYPVLGDRPMSSIRPTDIQAWAKRMAEQLAPSTVGVVHGIVSGIFRAAMRDRAIAHNPCDGTKLPKVTKSRVEPLATEIVFALADAVPDRYRALVILAAGSGMRQGECFGLTADRIDFLRRIVHVDRQLLTVSGRVPFLGPPKTPASVRTIPLPTVVVDALPAHLAAYPPLEDEFVFVTDAARPIRRTAFGDTWRAAVKAAGAPAGTGFHELRHHHASLLIRHGESVKGLQARLGHVSASGPLAHLLPLAGGQRRPDPYGGRRCPFCGLRAD